MHTIITDVQITKRLRAHAVNDGGRRDTYYAKTVLEALDWCRDHQETELQITDGHRTFKLRILDAFDTPHPTEEPDNG